MVISQYFVINKIHSLLNIRTNESKPALLLVGIMFFSTAGYSLGGTGIEALYFARFGTGLLPYLYMGLGICSLVSTLVITGLLSRVKRERMYIIVPFAAVIFLMLAWGLLFSNSKFVYPSLWLGKEALNTIVSMITWNTAGAVCDSRQAKRLFPLFNASRILGAVIGGLGIGLLVKFIGAQNLVIVWALSMSAVFVMARILMGGKSIPEPRKQKRRAKRRSSSFIIEMNKGWQYVRTSALMRWMSVAAILFSVLYFSIALPFSRSATLQYPNENELASFLGLFNGLSTAAAFITSIFFANRMFARFGIMNMILALPIIYVFGFGALTVFNIFPIIIAFRFAQMLWLSGMADAAYQTMFSAVPPEKRDQVNAFLNGVPEQAGVFLAGGILIIGEASFTTQQLYFVGLVAAITTTFIIWRASSAYRGALVSSLQEGRPTIFSGRATTYDSTSLAVALENIKHPDPLVWRVSVEMLGEMNNAAALIPALQDDDSDVRIAALKGVAHHPPALLEVSALLADPEPAVRQQAIRTLRVLSPNPRGLHILLEPILHDGNTHVQIEAALGLLKTGEYQEARELIRNKCAEGSLDECIHALNAMSELGDREAYALIAARLQDRNPSIRRAAALALASCGEDAIPTLISFLDDKNLSAREGVAQALAKIGKESMLPTITTLNNDGSVDGALLALSYLPVNGQSAVIKTFAAKKIKSALYYEDLAQKINSDFSRHSHLPDILSEEQRRDLLIDSIRARAHHDGIQVLQAFSLLDDRESIQVAIDNLQSKEPTQRANALETLESIRNSRLIRPLLRLWESSNSQQVSAPDYAQDAIHQLLRETDNWLRACAVFAVQHMEIAKPILDELALSDPNPLVREVALQGESMDIRLTLPIMERVLLLRRVPLLADLIPSDLQRVAELATEYHADDEEVIFEQGDAGEEMYIIVHGEVKVMVGNNEEPEKEVARRKVGDVIGEMSLISGESRIATLIAAGEIHLLCLDRKSFEGLLRERPEVSFAVMRVLCARLKEATNR